MSKTASKTGRLGSLIAKAWSRLFLATRKLLSEGRPAANCRRFCSSARSLGFGLKIAFPSSGFGRHGANGIRVLKGVFRSQSTILRWTAFRTGPSGIGHTLSGRAFRVPVAAARCPADFPEPRALPIKGSGMQVSFEIRDLSRIWVCQKWLGVRFSLWVGDLPSAPRPG